MSENMKNARKCQQTTCGDLISHMGVLGLVTLESGYRLLGLIRRSVEELFKETSSIVVMGFSEFLEIL